MTIGAGLYRLYESFSDEFLYGKFSEQKYNQYLINRSFIPLYSEYADMKYAQRSTKEYLHRHGMDYSDIHNPNNLPSTFATTNFSRSAYNYVSHNIKRLYK